MPTFNVSFLNPALKKSGGSGAGILADQLAILENSLGKDGFLSPGDYDILIDKAREIQMGNSMTADQRSAYDVKISTYEKLKEVQKINGSSDIEKMNKTLLNEAAQDVMVVGNNPQEFIKARKASLEAKLNDLAEVIQRKDEAGDNTVDYYNEYNATLQEYRNKVEAMEAMGTFDQTNPIEGYVAYVTTNKNGEIVDVDYGKYGEKSGYAETNGMIDGFQVYGKINYKDDGNNYFKMGDKTFTAADMLTQDPNNPGAFKPTKLMADVTGTNFKKAPAGYVNMSADTVRVQSYLPANSWAKGTNGTIYKRREDGGYTKYINADETKLGITEPVLNLPDAFEQSLMRGVSETIDASAPITPDQGMMQTPNTNMNQPITPGVAPTSMNFGLDNPFNPGQQKSTMSNPTPSATVNQPTTQAYRTPQKPSEASSSSPIQNAKRTIQSGVQAFKNLFSR